MSTAGSIKSCILVDYSVAHQKQIQWRTDFCGAPGHMRHRTSYFCGAPSQGCATESLYSVAHRWAGAPQNF